MATTAVTDLRPLLAGLRAGMSGAEVGRWLGISRERVRQIWTRETGDPIPRIHRSKDQHSIRLRRLMASVSIDDAGCWLWTGKRYPTDYGVCAWFGRDRYAHRVMYREMVGPIPTDRELDHLCRVRACVNPDHLEPVTHRENMLRSPIAEAAKNARKTHCQRGHEYGGDNLVVYASQPTRRYCRACVNASNRAYAKRRRAALKAAA